MFLPAAASSDRSNRYGEAYADPLAGKTKVDVKYGNFRLEGASAGLNVTLDYGNGTVVKSGDAIINVSYSKLNLNEVGNVSMTSKYSKLMLDDGGDLTADSRYDEFHLAKIGRLQCTTKYGNMAVGSATSITATGQYTDFKVEKLKNTGDFDLMYGVLRIESVSKGFSKINLVGKYSDFKIG